MFVVVAGTFVALMASPAWAELLKGQTGKMVETSGQMIDSSGNNRNGTPKDVRQGVRGTASTARRPTWPCPIATASTQKSPTSR